MNESTTTLFTSRLGELETRNPLVMQWSMLTNSLRIGFKTMFYGRKWIIYLLINTFIMLMTAIFVNWDVIDVKADFVSYIFENYFPFIFVFGCFILSLPLAADEISDHMVDLYLVRPVRREIHWTSRWIVMNVVVYAVNVVLSIAYYLLVCVFANGDFFSAFFDNIIILGKMLLLLIPSTMIYAGLFLLVSSIGTKGFTWAFFLAIFEPLFLSVLFLRGNPYIPQTNIYRIADWLFSPEIGRELFNNDIRTLQAGIYSIVFCIVTFFLGAWYWRRREFN